MGDGAEEKVTRIQQELETLALQNIQQPKRVQLAAILLALVGNIFLHVTSGQTMLPVYLSTILFLVEAAWLVVFRQHKSEYFNVPHILNAVISTAVIVTLALLCPFMQHSLETNGTWWIRMGEPAANSNVSGQAGQCSDCEPQWHVMILGAWLMYNDVLVLRVKHATISTAVGLAFHEVLTFLLGVTIIRQSFYLQIICMVSLVAKRQLEVQEGTAVAQQSEQQLEAKQEKSSDTIRLQAGEA